MTESLGEIFKRIGYKAKAIIVPEQARKAPGDPPAQRCPQCLGYGFQIIERDKWHPDFPGTRVSCDNPYHQGERVGGRLRVAGLPANAKTFEELENNAGTALALALAHGIAPKPWLILTGPPGSGKSALAIAAVMERCKTTAAAYIVLRDALEELRASYERSKMEGIFNFEIADSYPLLFSKGLVAIDDLGALRLTDWAAERVIDVIDFRWRNQLDTIITHDMDGARLRATLDRRVLDRLEDQEIVLGMRLPERSYRSGRAW